MRVLGLAGCALFVLGCSAHGSTQTKDTQEPLQAASQPVATTSSESAEERDVSTALTSLETGARPAVVEPSPEPVAANVLPPEGVMGVIDRAGLVMIIDAGLGRFFQRVRVAPEMNGAKFVGFRITQIDPAWSNVPLQSGDVIRRVNGQPIERPEQAMSAFERLRSADELVVDFTREGVEATLRFAIQ